MNNKGLTIFNTVFSVVLLVAILFLFVGNNKENDEAISTEINNDTLTKEVNLDNQTGSEAGSFGAIKVVYINTDTLWEQYEYVTNELSKLERQGTKIQNMYEAKMRKYQSEYQDYIKNGSALSLQQQKDRENSLKQQQQEIQDIEEEVSQKFIYKKKVINNQINDTIIAFINRYRVANGYDIILQYSYLSGVLSATKKMDVTADVVAKLNEEYQAFKK